VTASRGAAAEVAAEAAVQVTAVHVRLYAPLQPGSGLESAALPAGAASAAGPRPVSVDCWNQLHAPLCPGCGCDCHD
jgi:hypothetical protein